MKDLGESNDNKFAEKPLPLGWKQSLPKADHAWVLKALFKVNTKIGKPELDMARYIAFMYIYIKIYSLSLKIYL